MIEYGKAVCQRCGGEILVIQGNEIDFGDETLYYLKENDKVIYCAVVIQQYDGVCVCECVDCRYCYQTNLLKHIRNKDLHELE